MSRWSQVARDLTVRTIAGVRRLVSEKSQVVAGSAHWGNPKRTATFFLAENYQDAYLRDLASLSRNSYPEVQVDFVQLGNMRGRFRRIAAMTAPYSVGFHAQPFRTERFPGTARHVLISHGIDSGRFDALGSFSFGPGRTLSREGRLLYDYVFVSSPWSIEAAVREVPALAGRVLLCGDARADRILAQASRGERSSTMGESLTLGLASGHGPHSAFRRLGEELLYVASSLSKDCTVVLFFHPYERQHQPMLWKKVQQLVRENPRVTIAEGEHFEFLLSSCDALVCDYSSTALYFSLLRRPIAFTPFDTDLLLDYFPTMSLRREVSTVSSAEDILRFGRAVLSGRDLQCPSEDFTSQLYPDGTSQSIQGPSALSLVYAGLLE